MENLELGEYYRINGTKKILYWDGNKWMKPVKDIRGCYGSYICDLEKQPKVKKVEKVSFKPI